MDNDKRKQLSSSGGAFFSIGLVFFILGVSGKTAFLGVGIAFFTIGIVFIAQARKGGDKKDDAP